MCMLYMIDVCFGFLFVFFFFKQKTAYEMRISDWSSDVCSSDLTLAYRDELTQRLGLNLVNVTPDPEELAKKDETGLRWSYDPDGCCEIRKVKPLEKEIGRASCRERVCQYV